MGNRGHRFTAKERRILITHWVGTLQIIQGIYALKGLIGRRMTKLNQKVCPGREAAVECEVPDTEPPLFDEIRLEGIDSELEETDEDIDIDLEEDRDCSVNSVQCLIYSTALI